MNRQLYQMGGQGIMQLGNGQEEPIFPRLETLSQNLGQAEQTLGAPSNDQFNASSITTAITGRPQMNKGGSPEEEMEDIKEFYYGRRRGEQEDLLDEYQRFKMRKDFLRRYPRDEARFGGRMGYPRTGIGSLANRQGYFFGGIGDVLGSVGDIAGDIFGSVGDVVGGVGDVLGDVVGSDIFQKAIPYALAYFSGNPAFAASGEGASFLPSFLQAGGTEGGLGSFGNILGNIGSFMPQGETSGFNPYQFASNLISSAAEDLPPVPDRTPDGGGIVDVLGTILGQIGGRLPESIDAISKLLSKNKELAALTAGGTLGKLTYEEMKRLNEELKRQYAQYETGKEAKRTQYRTPESRAQLPGYRYSGVPSTVADVYRAPAMKGGIMNIPMGKPRTNSVGVKEIDYRQSGGFVPPVGVKEKADDIPAMLSNNEFVFTADAVRGAGGGSVNKGAQKMYSLMRQLEGRA